MDNPFEIISGSLSHIKKELAHLKRDMQRLAETHTGNNGKRLMTAKEAANYLGIPISGIYQLCHKRKLAYHRPGKHSYFSQEDLDDYMRQNRIRPVEEMVRDPLPSRKGKK